jgi:antitoxin HigA-1
MALRIGKLCGNGGDIWIRLQTRYDMQMAEIELGDALDAIPLLKAA